MIAQEDNLVIHRLRTFGYSISQIARELGLDRTTVRTPRGNRVDGTRWHRGGEVEQFLRTHPPAAAGLPAPLPAAPEPAGTDPAAGAVRGDDEPLVRASRCSLGDGPPDDALVIPTKNQTLMSHQLAHLY